MVMWVGRPVAGMELLDCLDEGLSTWLNCRVAHVHHVKVMSCVSGGGGVGMGQGAPVPDSAELASIIGVRQASAPNRGFFY